VQKASAVTVIKLVESRRICALDTLHQFLIGALSVFIPEDGHQKVMLSLRQNVIIWHSVSGVDP
jgi:hypothetical protein